MPEEIVMQLKCIRHTLSGKYGSPFMPIHFIDFLSGRKKTTKNEIGSLYIMHIFCFCLYFLSITKNNKTKCVHYNAPI